MIWSLNISMMPYVIYEVFPKNVRDIINDVIIFQLFDNKPKNHLTTIYAFDWNIF